MLRPHYAGEIQKRNNRRSFNLDLCLIRTRSGKSPDYRDINVFKKLCFQNVFRPHENAKPAPVFKFLSFEERFRKAPLS